MIIRANRANQEQGLDMTPMIDTVFNLLIFFLVAGSFQQAEREMHIALPSASAATPVSAALRDLTINVDADGKLFVGGRTVTPAELRGMVADSVKQNPEQKATIRGDRHTAYENVVRALDACKAGGIEEPYIDTVLE